MRLRKAETSVGEKLDKKEKLPLIMNQLDFICFELTIRFKLEGFISRWVK